MKRFFILGIARPLFLIVFVLLFLLSFLYLHTKIYDFPEAKPFSGNQWYNPYQDVQSGDEVLKANFHAHTIAWGGLSNGADTEEELIAAYEDDNYDVIGISNYHRNSNASKEKGGLFFPIYEHGYNIFKSHKQVFGATKEIYMDYPFFQLLSHKQDIAIRLKKSAKAIAINHPINRNGHSKEDLSKMVGYDFMEVLSNSGSSIPYWDVALSAGRLSWILSNDDTHDVHDSTHTFRKWTYIFSEGKNQDEVLGAMKAGKMYGVSSVVHGCKTKLEICKIEGDSLKVKFDQLQNSIALYTQDGAVVKSVYNTAEASFKIPKKAPYLRVFGYTPDCHIVLNPIVKWDGNTLPLAANMQASVNWPLTILAKILVVLIIFVEGFIIVKTSKWLKKVAKR